MYLHLLLEGNMQQVSRTALEKLKLKGDTLGSIYTASGEPIEEGDIAGQVSSVAMAEAAEQMVVEPALVTEARPVGERDAIE